MSGTCAGVSRLTIDGPETQEPTEDEHKCDPSKLLCAASKLLNFHSANGVGRNAFSLQSAIEAGFNRSYRRLRNPGYHDKGSVGLRHVTYSLSFQCFNAFLIILSIRLHSSKAVKWKLMAVPVAEAMKGTFRPYAQMCRSAHNLTVFCMGHSSVFSIHSDNLPISIAHWRSLIRT